MSKKGLSQNRNLISILRQPLTAYYDKEQPGTAAFLREAVLIYTGMKK